MSVKLAALETVYAVLEHPMVDDHRGIRTSGGPRNAANDAIAKKIVEALQKWNLLRETIGSGEFPNQVYAEPKPSFER